MSGNRVFTSMERVSRIAQLSGLHLREPVETAWELGRPRSDTTAYYPVPGVRFPGAQHDMVYEVHFTRSPETGNWQFVMAFLRKSSGDGANDEDFRTLRELTGSMTIRGKQVKASADRRQAEARLAVVAADVAANPGKVISPQMALRIIEMWAALESPPPVVVNAINRLWEVVNGA